MRSKNRNTRTLRSWLFKGRLKTTWNKEKRKFICEAAWERKAQATVRYSCLQRWCSFPTPSTRTAQWSWRTWQYQHLYLQPSSWQSEFGTEWTATLTWSFLSWSELYEFHFLCKKSCFVTVDTYKRVWSSSSNCLASLYSGWRKMCIYCRKERASWAKRTWQWWHRTQGLFSPLCMPVMKNWRPSNLVQRCVLLPCTLVSDRWTMERIRTMTSMFRARPDGFTTLTSTTGREQSSLTASRTSWTKFFPPITPMCTKSLKSTEWKTKSWTKNTGRELWGIFLMELQTHPGCLVLSMRGWLCGKAKYKFLHSHRAWDDRQTFQQAGWLLETIL